MEDRSNLTSVSDVNRGNFLELLRLRSQDNPILASHLTRSSNATSHANLWISPDIQNELLDICRAETLRLISQDVGDKPFSLMIDETSDITKTEQVSICIRFVNDDDNIQETFLGFYDTASTSAEALFELAIKVLADLGLDIQNLVGLCFDGASNMSGQITGLQARFKAVVAWAIYVHCYAHQLNLVIVKTITDVLILSKVLGVVQALHNFITASPKRNNVYMTLPVALEGGKKILTLKSQSQTRWAYKWKSVQAVINHLTRIVLSLAKMIKDATVESKTRQEARGLLVSVASFEFIFGLVIAKTILQTTHGLTVYLQRATLDVITARQVADATLQTLRSCRDEQRFMQVWNLALSYTKEVKEALTASGVNMDFKEAQPPLGQPSLRHQALCGEGAAARRPVSAQDHLRVSAYNEAFDLCCSEMAARFATKDNDILCAASDVCQVLHDDNRANKAMRIN